jgi:hypothetical protein
MGHVRVNHGSCMSHIGHMWVKCGSNVGQIGLLWVNHRIYIGHVGHVWVMYGSHDSYMDQNGSYWLHMSNGYCHTGQQLVINICVIYVIIMWVSQGINGSYGSYMSQPRCIYKGHLGHIWTINHGSYMGLMGYYEGQKYELNGSFVGQPWCIWVI